MRFVSIIMEPGWFSPRYGVVDLQRQVLICQCTESNHADEIAKCMSLQWDDRKELLQIQEGAQTP